MSRTIKIFGVAAVVAVAATAGWSAMAQMPMGGGHGMGKPGMMMGMGGGHGSGAAHATERLAALKTELGITAAQQPAWDAYAKVLQDTAASMQAQHAEKGGGHGQSEQDRSARMTAMQDRHQTAMAAVKTAAETLLASLDDAQKAKAQTLLPGLAVHGPGMMQHAGTGMQGKQHGKGTH